LNLHFPTLLFIADCISTKIDKPIHAKNSFLGGATLQAGQVVRFPTEFEKRSEPYMKAIGVSVPTIQLENRDTI